MPGQQGYPRTVYISHWLPLSSETFVYYEAEGLHDRGFPVSGFSLYGRCDKELGPRLLNGRLPVERLGIAAIPRVIAAVARGIRRQPRISLEIFRFVFLRRWRDLEQRLENAWAGLSGFYLAERCQALGVQHVHAAWSSGPGTAAWVINRLTGLPFSMAALAGDIRPPDGALEEKLAAASFTRVDASHNLAYLAQFEPEGVGRKHHLVYNVRTLASSGRAEVRMERPLRLLCVGRLVETKGFQYAIEAVRLLKQRGLEARLTIAGSGAWEKRLKKLARDLDVEAEVSFPGFVIHDQVPGLMLASDIFLMPCVVRRDKDKSDGLPTVIVEAMTHGLPVISTPVAGVADAVRHEETGLMVPERDASGLADAIQRLAEDREGALAMAENAKALVSEMFDPDRNLQKLMDLFSRYARRPEGQSNDTESSGAGA